MVDNMSVCNFPLRRIIVVFPDKDNKIWVVSVKTRKAMFKRPITKNILITENAY